MSRPAELLAPNRALMFPRFETYRLQSLDPDEDVVVHALPGAGATQSRVGYNSQQLSFKEVRSRISWDHLDTLGNRGVYVDAEWNVVAFEVDDKFEPTFSTLASLPVPISSSSQQAEYPRALPLSPTTWAVSPGSGSLYILEVSPPGEGLTGRFIARYDMPAADGSSNASPFLLYAAHQEGDNAYRLLLCRPVVSAEAEASKYRPRKAVFDLIEVDVLTNIENGIDDEPQTLFPSWSLRGNDLPYWASWAEGGWLVASEDPFSDGPVVRTPRPREQEGAKAARQHEARVSKLGLGAQLPDDVEAPRGAGAEADEAEEEDAKVFPFSWTQNETSVTIKIPVPGGTPRRDIALSIAPEYLDIKITSPSLSAALFTFLERSRHSFWSEIDADESTWTYHSAIGEIEVELQKLEGDARWPSIFVPSDDDDDAEVEDVPETFAASTLAAIRDSFNNVKTRSADEPQGNHPALPGLLREELDYDLEDDDYEEAQGSGAISETNSGTVGRSVLLGHVKITPDGPQATWPRQPTSILSLPVTSAGPDLPADTGVIVKFAVDGLLFAPVSGSDPSRAPWIHLGTNPALGFVLSSKRDLRLVRHLTRMDSGVAKTVVLGFESGSGNGQGNAYIYYPPSADLPTSARQGVIGVSGSDRGGLLGVGSVDVGGRNVAVALCERALVVLKGVEA